MDKRVEKMIRARDILMERKMKLDVGISCIEEELVKEAEMVYEVCLEVKSKIEGEEKPEIGCLEMVGDGYGHECPRSPIDNCVYDTSEDPAMDSCVFCGQPWERK